MENEQMNDQPSVNEQAVAALEGNMESEQAESTDVVDEVSDAQVQEEQMITMTVNGEEVSKPLSEIQSLAQQGMDYTQKTQQLANDRESIKTAQDFQSWIEANPDKYSQIEGIVKGNQPEAVQTDPYADDYVDPKVRALETELSTVKATSEKMYNYLATQDSNAQLKQIENDPKFDGLFQDTEFKTMLVQNANSQVGQKTLTEVANDMHRIVNKRLAAGKSQAANKVIKDIQNKNKVVTPGTGSMDAPKPVNTRNMSMDQLNKFVLDNVIKK